MELPVEYGAMEAAIRTTVADRFRALPDCGVIHERERYVPNLAEWIRLMTVPGPRGRKVVRGMMVTLLGFEPRRNDGGMCRNPLRLFYAIEIVYGFDDGSATIPDSASGFNALIMRAFDSFENSHELGFNEVNHDGLETIENAELRVYDGTVAHVTTLGLTVEVER
ncbi:MAG: hypothetical protein MSG64_06370 [Pyrinomonadaceae bacterium MAG19_C2-C3]|nr:hypothetical protein [Pyrinomonadaceae bacterium MAG19_C2-C3]